MDLDVKSYITTWICHCSEYGKQEVMAVDDLNYLPIQEKTDMPDWMQEFMSDPESVKRIVDTVYHHAMSLKDCAQLIEMAAPFYDRMASDGVVAAIKDMTEQVRDINTMLKADVSDGPKKEYEANHESKHRQQIYEKSYRNGKLRQ